MSELAPEIKQKIRQLQSRIEQADDLEDARRVDEAYAAYQACLQMVARENIPLFYAQLAQIWMGIGFCYADRNLWRQALEWYHRTELVLNTAYLAKSDPRSPQIQALTKKWLSHLPRGTKVIMECAGHQLEAHLADLYDSMALAYDNDDQFELAKKYYQRSLELHSRLGNSLREAQVCWHQAVGYQRRQQWFDLELVADRMLHAAEQAQTKPLILVARRLLAQSQIHQNRLFKTLEHFEQAVILGRELQDAGLPNDENHLRQLVHIMRPHVLNQGEADFLEPLVRAESILNDPNLAQDRALLQKWAREQSPTYRPGMLPVGKLDSLETVAMVLEYFALRHCGPSVQTENRPQKGLMGILGKTQPVERHVWSVTQEEMQFLRKNENGKLETLRLPCAILELYTHPQITINVSLTPTGCDVKMMEERPLLPGLSQTGFFSVAQESVPPQTEALLNCLNGFIQQGLLIKTDHGLKYAGPQYP